jgi:hypothetical protein
MYDEHTIEELEKTSPILPLLQNGFSLWKDAPSKKEKAYLVNILPPQTII